MAGRFLTIEEAAAALGVSVDEINRLVDRKHLFPMRDGTTLKFKADDVTRAKASLDEDAGDSGTSVTDDMTLDLDSPSLGGSAASFGSGAAGGPAAGNAAGASGVDDVVIGDAVDDAEWVLGGTSGVHVGSQTLVRGGGDAPVPAEGSGMAVGEGSLLGGSDLEIDSLIASSPSLASAAANASAVAPDAGDMTLDLSLGSSPAASAIGGSAIGGSNPSLAGAGLSGPLDSGLSLEDGDLAGSGIDLAVASGGMTSAIGGDLGGEMATSGLDLGGDAFELGDTGEDESASVVIATEDTGDSSFFAAAADDSASVSYDESSAGLPIGPLGGDYPLEYAPDMTFSVWQILGLVCCMLLLLGGTLVMFDLLWTIRAPRTTALSAPLLNALTEAFGWR